MAEKKRRMIILSDMFGIHSSWLEFYVSNLQNHFDITVYDCCELANIPKKLRDETELHQQFIDGGILKSVESLLKKEIESTTILAFSIGGTIAWKAILAGLKVDNLLAISSTRLRYETQKPSSNITLFYGDQDLNAPNDDWFKSMTITPTIFENMGHEMYRKKEIATIICSSIIR